MSKGKKQEKKVQKKGKKKIKPIKFTKKDIPKINYGVIHSQVGFADGVSIVMEQIESVMCDDMGVPKSNINYLVGKSKNPSPRIRQSKILWHKYKPNILPNNHFSEGLGGSISEKVEKSINLAKDEIKKFIDERNIDVLIVHNSSHPVNFISSVALSRYYRDEIAKGHRTPKYLLWWHDSHLERDRYAKPSMDIKRYLYQGVPGSFVEYILFINSLQFDMAQKYLLELDKRSPGYYENMLYNHTIVYNTATTLINTIDDLENEKLTERTEKFLDAFKIRDLLKEHRVKLDDTQFCLQHTRIVPRKRIDFALRYAYELYHKLAKTKKRKAMVFFVSGHHGDETGNYKKELKDLNKRLAQHYNTNRFFLIFAEDYNNSGIFFEEIPLIIARLGGIATYFSEIEGFGNNLLEVLAAGLIPIIYTYPVFVKDIAKYKFKVIALDSFTLTEEPIDKAIEIIQKDRMKKIWGNKNLEILKKKFSHRIISFKLKRAIIRERTHI